MEDERFSDEYPEDDAEFYDGLEDSPGSPYPTIYQDAGLGGMGAGYLVPPRAPESAPPQRLLTPEEFMRKYGLTG